MIRLIKYNSNNNMCARWTVRACIRDETREIIYPTRGTTCPARPVLQTACVDQRFSNWAPLEEHPSTRIETIIQTLFKTLNCHFCVSRRDVVFQQRRASILFFLHRSIIEVLNEAKQTISLFTLKLTDQYIYNM